MWNVKCEVPFKKIVKGKVMLRSSQKAGAQNFMMTSPIPFKLFEIELIILDSACFKNLIFSNLFQITAEARSQED